MVVLSVVAFTFMEEPPPPGDTELLRPLWEGPPGMLALMIFLRGTAGGGLEPPIEPRP